MLLDCITVFLDPQCIVSQKDLQHKILNWSTLLPSCPYIQVGQERGGRNSENCLPTGMDASQMHL